MLLNPRSNVISKIKKEIRLCLQLLTCSPKTFSLLAISIRKNVTVGNRIPLAT